MRSLRKMCFARLIPHEIFIQNILIEFQQLLSAGAWKTFYFILSFFKDKEIRF